VKSLLRDVYKIDTIAVTVVIVREEKGACEGRQLLKRPQRAPKTEVSFREEGG
jgi:hypothetical protein